MDDSIKIAHNKEIFIHQTASYMIGKIISKELGELVNLQESNGLAADLPHGEAVELLPEKLRRDIVSGALPAGSRLKTQELARRYGTSVNPIREALHQLRGEGFVILSRNKGASVRQLDDSFVRNIFDIRALIEPYLVRLFVGHATQDDLDRMAAIQEEIEALDNTDDARLRELDAAFHNVSYQGHFNAEALAIRERHGEVIQALGVRYPPSPARRGAQNLEHREIIAALKAADEDRAARIVEKHARGAERHLLEQLRRRPSTTV